MGIPRFYRWLKGRYPLIRFDLTDSHKQMPIFDNFYIDFNALVYQCIRQSGCFLKNKVQPLTFEQIADRVFEYLLELVRVVNPRKLLFIAFDGVAPRAKINQSRDRRFRSGIEDIEFFEELVRKVGIKTEEYFQANSISPGTDFLYRLCTVLKNKIMELMGTEWRGLNVFYSDCCVPGEGEHKIMDFLRYSKQAQLFNNNTTHCVYSPDADVILLTLTLGLDYICLIKEDTTQLPSQSWTATSTFRKSAAPQFELVMINILREYFEKEFEEVLSSVKDCKVQDIINDLVLLMAFVGNDFLPVEFCFVLKDNHMDALFNQYKKYLMEHEQFINNGGAIDWKNVSKLLKLARRFEANMIAEMKNQKRSRQTQKHQMEGSSIFSDKEEDKEDEKDSEIEKFEVEDSKIVNGIDSYYQSRFNIQDRRASTKFEHIIKKYIEGLEFYCQYYYRGLPSWTWHYPYHYTPLLCDVDDYISTHNIKVELAQDEPFDPILALMFMFPEQNFGLLPKPVAQELTNPNCILKTPIDYFPKKFSYDKYETLKYNQRAIIEFLHDLDVKKVYNSIPKEKYTKEELERNVRKNTIFFCQKGDSFVGIEVIFDEKYKEELRKLIRPKYSDKQKDSAQIRFPNLAIYGPKCKLNEKGRLVPDFKFKYQGNPAELMFFNNFVGFIEKVEKCTPDYKEYIESEFDKQGISGACQNYFIVKRGQFVREIERFNVVLTKKEVLVPDYAIFKAPNYDYIHKTTKFENKDLYKLKERVVILTSKYFGCTGTIEELDEKEVKVKLSADPIKSQNKIQELDEDFYTVSYVLDHLEISADTFFSIISEVIVLPKMPSKKDFNERLPTALNFGLNFIDVANVKIVPQYVRCNFAYENTRNPQQIFNHIEVSESGLKILEKYVQLFHWLIEALEDSKVPKLRKEFKVTALFPQEKDPNIKAYQQFVKLYSLGNVGTFYSIYSRVAQTVTAPFYTQKKGSNAIVSFNYHQIISRNQALLAPPAYKNQPEYHDIGARVILLRTLQIGYVVGIDDLWVHLLVGKSQRKAKVRFTDVYNESWEHFLSKDIGKVWNLQVSYYTPTYWKKAISHDKAK